MDLINRFKDFLSENKLLDNKVKILAAVSGGIDSMVLCHLLESTHTYYAVAHVNHHTRSGASDLDQAFVLEYCKARAITCHLHSLDYKQDVHGNFHDYARNARYSFFKDLGYTSILTAHHKDDAVETIFVNFLNGRSLRTIPVVNSVVLRPLLQYSKKEILSYAKANTVSYITDSSNSENKYLRNLIRNKLLPSIRKVTNDADSKLLNLSIRTERNESLLRALVERLIEKKITDQANNYETISLDKQIFIDLESADFIFHALSKYGINFSQAEDILSCLEKVGRQFYTTDHTILVDRANIIIYQRRSELETKILSLAKLPQEIRFGSYKFMIELTAELTEFDSANISIPRKKLGDTLTIRTWKSGDLFYPYGMNGQSQSLKKYFLNQKINRAEKSKIPLFLNGSEIVWIAGYRSDERYKVCDETDGPLLLITLI